MRRHMAMGLVVSVMLVALAGPAMADPWSSGAAAPPPAEVVQATNAMLRPADVPAALKQDKPSQWGGFSTGFTNSFVNEDPAPVCSSPQGLSVFPTIDGAIVYQAANGHVSQYVYAYPNEGAAVQAWDSLTKDLRSRCQGSASDGGVTYTSSTSAIPGIAGTQGWGVSSSIDSRYSAVHRVGSFLMYVTASELAPEDKAGQVAVKDLALALLGRWVDRATLPITQNASITRGATTMLQGTDIGTATPVPPVGSDRGAHFNGQQPGGKPIPCAGTAFDVKKQMPPAGIRLLSLHGITDPSAVGGYLMQQVYVFATTALAQRAWTVMKRDLGQCTKNAGKPVPANQPFDRTLVGESPLSFNGVPGLWVRGMTTYDQSEDGGEGTFSRSGYVIDLLVDNAIQRVIYGRTMAGMREVPVDQAAVNAIAETLALRWQAGGNTR